MKRLILAIAAVSILFGAASCKKENLGVVTPGNGGTPLDVIKATVAVPAADGKLSLVEDTQLQTVTPAFEVDDELFGFTGDVKYAYKCTSVDEDGNAIFTRTSENAPSAEDGTIVTLFFAPGYNMDSIKEGKLAIDITGQKAGIDSELPVIMAAQGAVESGECVMAFGNEVSIISVNEAVLTDAEAGTEMASLSVSGLHGKIEYSLDSEDGSLVSVMPAETDVITNTGVLSVAEGSKFGGCVATFQSEETTHVFTATAADGAKYSWTATSKAVAENSYVKVAGKTFDPKYVAQIGSDKYMTLAKAVATANEATENVTVAMLEDVSESHSLTINNSDAVVTLDFNGHTIASTATPALICSTNFVVDDLSASKNGGIKAADGNSRKQALVVRGGDGNKINAGTFIGYHPAGVVRIGGKGTTTIAEGVTVTSNTEVTRTEGSRAVLNAFSNSDDAGTTLIINGGTFTSRKCGVLRTAYGAIEVKGGTFVSDCDSLFHATQQAYESSIAGGYFFAGTTPATRGLYIGGSSFVNGKSKISGGYFNSTLEPGEEEISYIKSGYQFIELPEAEVKDGRSYPYSVVEYIPATNEASVNGVEYAFFDDAVKAAKDYNGEADKVTLKLLENVEVTGKYDLTNKPGKDFYLDINGKTLTVSVDSCFASDVDLYVVDTGAEKGLITTSKPRLFVKNIFSNTKDTDKPVLGGDLHLVGCHLESTDEQTSTGTGSNTAMISLYGKSGTGLQPKLFMDGAVIDKKATGKALFIRYSNMEMNNSEVNCTCSEGETSGWCVYFYATCTVNIENSSFYSQNNACLRSNSSNPKVNIKSGTYLYSGDGVNWFSASNTGYGVFNLYSGSFFSANPTPTPSVANVVVKEGSVQGTSETKFGRTYSWTVAK